MAPGCGDEAHEESLELRATKSERSAPSLTPLFSPEFLQVVDAFESKIGMQNTAFHPNRDCS
jgi:hypothetical protein